MALYEKKAHELLELVRNKEVKAVEIVDDLFERISHIEPQVQAYLSLEREESLRQAAVIDQMVAKGEDLPLLAGIPVAVKDNMATRDFKTTCASKMLADYQPPFDATVVSSLKEAGVIINGKVNLDEFAMGSSTENSALKQTKNPWNLSCVPGGSSGGSAAAVSAGIATMALGSDTGGSIRQPASYCGVVGLKPTYGRVSRYGLVAFASSLDQIGPITKDVTDAALLLQAIAKYDPRDSTSIPQPVPDYLAEMKQPFKGLKIGLPKEYLGSGISNPVLKAMENAVTVFRDLGAEVVDINLPYTEYALATYYIIASAEASSNLARYDGVRYGYRTSQEVADAAELFMKTREEGFGAEVKRRIMIGTYVLSAGYYDAYYRKAQQVRTLIREDFNQAFQKCDLIVTPTNPSVAFGEGAKTKDPLEMYLEDICTITCNLAGLPGISVPCGLAEGLPIGMQLIGPAFAEGKLLKAAYNFEQATDFHKARPAL